MFKCALENQSNVADVVRRELKLVNEGEKKIARFSSEKQRWKIAPLSIHKKKIKMKIFISFKGLRQLIKIQKKLKSNDQFPH